MNPAQGGSHSTRNSMSSRMSHLFQRRQGQDDHSSRSPRSSGAFDVPIFMSRSSDHLERPYDEEAAGDGSPSHTMSAEYDEHRGVAASSVYSQSPNFRNRHSMDHIEEETHSESRETSHDLEAGTSTSCATSEVELVREKRRRRRRVAETYKVKIAAKKRLGMAFGVTTLAAVITCMYR